jgi:hypothetical protein
MQIGLKNINVSGNPTDIIFKPPTPKIYDATDPKNLETIAVT